MMRNISNLAGLYEKNRKKSSSEYFYQWRLNSLKTKISQEQMVTDLVSSMGEDLVHALRNVGIE